MDSVQDIRPFVCNECGSSFNKKWNLKVHMESHSDPFECEVCHLKFKFRHKLRSHMGRHTGIIKYNCKSCPAVFGYKRMLISHMHTHHGSPTHYCTGCGAHFSKKDDIETHGLLCLNIKKCNEEEEDCKPIVLHIAEEMARNNKKKGSEEPLFEYESCQQLQEKSKLITLQDRCNNEDIREEHYAYNKHSESRRDHESRHEEYSNLIASLTDSGDAEA
ncbi:zinc finger protein 37 homolog, partial [Penaeus japonicus]|uniref:zinc finger protein 37 homolog n=1 Tax=Penaeus japonicus TaxID=27405 RepID=UPI001C7135DF